MTPSPAVPLVVGGTVASGPEVNQLRSVVLALPGRIALIATDRLCPAATVTSPIETRLTFDSSDEFRPLRAL
jgi:hypothetical protein